jgi:hypothetical protein
MKRLFSNHKNWLWILGGFILFLVLLYQLFQAQQKLRSIRRQLQPTTSQTNNSHQKNQTVMKTVFTFVLLLLSFLAFSQNVGIGTTTPTEKLHVSGNTIISGNLAVGLPAAAYRLDVGGTARINGDLNVLNNNPGGTWFYLTNTSVSPTGWKIIAAADGKLKFFNTSNSSAITLLQNGNVGLGKDNPIYPLDVDGDAAVSGNFAIGGVLGFGHQVVFTETMYSASGIGSFNKVCPAGTKLLSGGGGYPGFDTNIAGNIEMIYNGPDPDFPSTRWRIYIWNKNNAAVPIRLYCICANIF